MQSTMVKSSSAPPSPWTDCLISRCFAVMAQTTTRSIPSVAQRWSVMRQKELSTCLTQSSATMITRWERMRLQSFSAKISINESWTTQRTSARQYFLQVSYPKVTWTASRDWTHWGIKCAARAGPLAELQAPLSPRSVQSFKILKPKSTKKLAARWNLENKSKRSRAICLSMPPLSPVNESEEHYLVKRRENMVWEKTKKLCMSEGETMVDVLWERKEGRLVLKNSTSMVN